MTHMTNQEKLKAVIKQAQSRGWMAGAEYFIGTKTWTNQLYIWMYKEGQQFDGALNDILFGTDFCEKFFRNIELCKPCNHVLAACEYGNAPLCHKIDMLSMTEPERIDFLYKHVEGEWKVEVKKCGCNNNTICVNCAVPEEPQPVDEVDTSINGAAIMNQKIDSEIREKLEEKGSFQIEPCCENGDMIVAHTCMKKYPAEVKEIELIPFSKGKTIYDSQSGFELAFKNLLEIAEKVNEMAIQVNANTKDIRDCKLNRN